MCHALRVRLSPAEKQEVRKLSGVVIPIYASIVLILLAVISITNVPRSKHVPSSIDVIAKANDSGSTRDVAPH